MKKLLMMIAMAVGFTVFADANDPLIPASVEAGQTYELQCKGEVVRTYTASKTMQMNFQADANLSDNAVDWTVVPVQGFDIGSFVCTYPNGGTLAAGERLLLVRCAEGVGFKGLSWDYKLVDSTNNKIVGTYVTADASGKFNVGDVSGRLEQGYDYVYIVLDTRLVDGTPSAVDENTNPKLVGGWGEFVSADGTAATASIKWTPIRMGLAESYPVSVKEFDFDPTLVLEKGFAVISPSEGKWRIYQLPQAWVEPFVSPELSLSAGTYWHLAKNRTDIPDPFTLESAYKFSAFDIQYEAKALAYLRGDYSQLEASDYKLLDDWNKQVAPFKEWNADFEVSFDRPVAANSVLLAGFYNYTSAWAGKYTFDWVGDGQKDPWVGSSPEKDLAAGEVTRLLYSYIGKSGNVTMTYDEICQKVIQFFCGVKNLSEKNYGTTMTVKLCIYENTGRCHESGRRVVIGTYEYTFCGPLDIEFAEGYNWPEDAALPEPNPLHTNHNGRLSFVLPAPTYTEKHDKLAFVGWSNDVDKTIMTYIPTNTWKAYKLYGTWKPAQTVVIKPDEDKPGDSASIKVADEWLEENLKGVSGDEVAEALQKPAEDGGKIPLWQTYVLGLNPSGTVSTVQVQKETENKALVVSTVEAPAPDSGFKVRYSLDKIESDEATIRKEGQMQEGKDITIDLDESTAGEIPTGYYKMNVIIMPEKGDGEPDVDKKVKVPSEVTVGVLQVATEEPVIPVAVPWTALSDKEANIPADQIVQPQGLEDGVLLHVYDEEGKYKTLKMAGGKWTTSDDHQIDIEGGTSESDQANAVPTVKRGSAMWLDRTGTDMSKPFYLMGQYNDKSAETQIVPPTEEGKTEYNLIAPTGIEETDLNTIETLVPGEKGENDKLMIVNNGNPVYCDYDPVTKKWGYNSFTLDSRGLIRKNRVTDGIKVTAGTGLWYISAGGSPTITWTGDEQEDSGN